MIRVYYIIINAALAALMGIDKYKAKHKKWRIAEKTLYLFGLLGGGLGGLVGMRIFHHKTKKPMFYAVYIFSIALHLTVFCLIMKGL